MPTAPRRTRKPVSSCVTDTQPEPFLKWAGGKRQLLQQFQPLFPPRRSYGTYFEPFLGGGAVFFHLLPRRARLSDTNAELVECYRVIQLEVEALIEALSAFVNDEAHFYRVRALDTSELSSVQRAARTIYLNRTCYNGLYRVNRSGLFNVPFGKNPGARICNAENLRAVSKALAGASLEVAGFEAVLAHAKGGDLVYFDPPYQPLSTTSYFTAYTRSPFGEAEQRTLADTFRKLHRLGCHVLLSNSDTPLIRELYKDFRIEQLLASRSINSKTANRGKIPELLVIGGATLVHGGKT